MSTSFATVDRKRFESWNLRVCNKIAGNFHLSNKKGLYYNMKTYCEALEKDVFEIIPLTFHVLSAEDLNYRKFE